jgi:hypothetical protein
MSAIPPKASLELLARLVSSGRISTASMNGCSLRAPSQICSEISKVPKPLISINADQTWDDLRLGRTSKGGKNETVTSSVVLVRTHFYPVRVAGLVRWASDGNGKASAGKY